MIAAVKSPALSLVLSLLFLLLVFLFLLLLSLLFLFLLIFLSPLPALLFPVLLALICVDPALPFLAPPLGLMSRLSRPPGSAFSLRLSRPRLLHLPALFVLALFVILFRCRVRPL